jgi:hypothetical protein
VTIPGFDVFALFTGKIVPVQWVFGYFMPDWWPKISWPWFVFVGCVVTLAISVLSPPRKARSSLPRNTSGRFRNESERRVSLVRLFALRIVDAPVN